jgi:DeoR/GlpR family transcriptional regulator of sugar metabolism
MRWFEEHRQQWIAETLRIFGYIQRKHLIRKFGISVPQASADLQQFQKDHPQAIRYDASKKRYINTLDHE